jgi:hypothetical protein
VMYEYPENARPVSDKDVALIDTALDDLAEFVTFEANSDHDAANAATSPISDDAETGHRTKTLRGVRSRIDYSAALLNTLVRVSKDTPLLLVRRFTFAVQLAHEVCHALTNAADGHKKWLDMEPFFPGAKTAEVGLTLEESLFGGSPSLVWGDENPTSKGAMKVYYKSKGRLSNLVGLYVLWPLPCTWTVREYQHKKLGLWMREADMAALKPKDIAYRVPLTELTRFFDTAFWAQESPDTQLERTVGFAFSSDENGVKSASEISKPEWNRYAPRGYRVSKNKAVVRK